MTNTDTRLRTEESSLAKWWEQFEKRKNSGVTQEIHVFVRSVSPAPGLHKHRRTLIDNIHSAATHDWIDGHDVTVLGSDICLCDACESTRSATDLLGTIEELRQWRTGGMQACGFTEREVDSTITDESYCIIKPPDIVLGIYSDGTLSGVFPCRIDGEVYTPSGFVRDLIATDEGVSRENETVSHARS